MPLLSKGGNAKYGTSVEEMTLLVDDYRLRNYDEDLKKISQLEGVEGVATALGSNCSTGLDGKDFDQRTKEFGSNAKPPIERSGKICDSSQPQDFGLYFGSQWTI